MHASTRASLLILALVTLHVHAGCTREECVRIHTQSGPNCWAHAIAAFIEVTYCELTCNRIALSVTDIEEKVRESCSSSVGHPCKPDSDEICFGMDGLDCALETIERRGVVDQFAHKPAPIKISRPRRICSSIEHLLDRVRCARNKASESPIIAILYASNNITKGGVLVDVGMNPPNHVALITSINAKSRDIRITLQDSHGMKHTDNGFVHIDISAKDLLFDDDGLSPNRILSGLFVADIEHIYEEQ